MSFLKELIKGDKAIWTIFFFLCLFSVMELYSASSMIAHKSASYFSPLTSHATHLLLGFGVLLILSNMPYRFFKVIPVFFGPLTLLMLIYLLLFGDKVNDAARAITILGFPLQPSEVAKICLVIYVAHTLSNYDYTDKERRFSTFLYIIIPVGVFCLFILPENLSQAALIGLVCFLMMIIGRIDWRHLASFTIGTIVFMAMSYLLIVNFFPNSGVGHRIETWENRFENASEKTEFPRTAFEIPSDKHQVYHAKMAIANGGMSPIGVLPGNSIERDFLPLAFSDFIFAIIIEETGLIGALLVMALYIYLIMRAFIIARKCRKAFPAFLIMGSALMIVIQALVNMSVAVNLIPVTGQPLPLISKGGSSILVTCAFIGMMLSVSRWAVDETELNSDFDDE